MELLITAETAFELRDKVLSLAALYQKTPAPIDVPETQLSFPMEDESSEEASEAPEKAPQKRGRKPKSQNAGTEPSEAQDASAQAPAEAESVESKAQSHAPVLITPDVVKELLKQVNIKKGMETVRALLDQFGVKRISDVPEDKYQAFAARCEQILE